HAQHHPARSQRIVRNPVDELPEFRLERRYVELFVDILQTIVQQRIWVGVVSPDHAHAFACPKGHGDHITRRELKTRRYGVRIGLAEAPGHQNVDNSAHSVPACLTDSGRLRKSERSNANLQSMSEFAASSDVSAEIARWMGYLGAERRMSQKTV